MIERYLTAVYKDGARGEVVDGQLLYDCWGLARAARVELYGRKLLASRAGEYLHDPEGFTAHDREQAAEMVEIPEPVPGCVVAVLRRRSGHSINVCLAGIAINRTGQGN